MTNQINLTKGNLLRNNSDRRDSAFINRTLWQIGASVGLFSGVAVLFGTIFLFVSEYFYGEKSHGVWQIFVAFVLLGFGAHCLDKIEESKKLRRLEFCRRHNISADRCSEKIIAATTTENS